MKHPIILVTGATRGTEHAVVDELLVKGVPVRAVVHSKDARSAALGSNGAETVVADVQRTLVRGGTFPHISSHSVRKSTTRKDEMHFHAK